MPQENSDKLICPKCQSVNGLKAEYCWACFHDFVPNTAIKTPTEPVQIKQRSALSQLLSHGGFHLVVFAISFGTVYGSWLIYNRHYPESAKPFVTVWIALLVLAWFSERHLPRPEKNLDEYWSFNPFEYKDNYNWFVLKWNVVLFLPRIVLGSLHLLLQYFVSPFK